MGTGGGQRSQRLPVEIFREVLPLLLKVEKLADKLIDVVGLLPAHFVLL